MKRSLQTKMTGQQNQIIMHLDFKKTEENTSDKE
jgi:hypothetical protein